MCRMRHVLHHGGGLFRVVFLLQPGHVYKYSLPFQVLSSTSANFSCQNLQSTISGVISLLQPSYLSTWMARSLLNCSQETSRNMHVSTPRNSEILTWSQSCFQQVFLHGAGPSPSRVGSKHEILFPIMQVQTGCCPLTLTQQESISMHIQIPVAVGVHFLLLYWANARAPSGLNKIRYIRPLSFYLSVRRVRCLSTDTLEYDGVIFHPRRLVKVFRTTHMIIACLLSCWMFEEVFKHTWRSHAERKHHRGWFARAAVGPFLRHSGAKDLEYARGRTCRLLKIAIIFFRFLESNKSERKEPWTNHSSSSCFRPRYA